jgi:hypothetical protein
METTAPAFPAAAPRYEAAAACRTAPRALLRLADWELTEARLRFVGMVVVAVVLWGLKPLHTGEALLFSLFCVVVCWETDRQIMFALRRRYPDYRSTLRRLSMQGLLVLGNTLAWGLGLSVLHNWLLTPHMSFAEAYPHCLACALPATGVVLLVYESAYFFGEWKRYYLRAASLEKERAVSQLAALKQQVDPHFLFNTLNTLAALVGDNAPAQEFLDELASVYRYVLSRRDQATVTVAEEMAFVESYVYLNRIRHQEAVRVSSQLPADILQRRVPPLSIQMLVENAIKHNAASLQRPLHIELRADQDFVSVSNNVQPKTTLSRSEGLGLRNLQEQFQLLAGCEIQVQPGPARFAVKLPLLSHASRTN